MALEYGMKLSGKSITKALIDTALDNMGFNYSAYETLRYGFRVDEIMDRIGFSLAFLNYINNPFGYEDEMLAEPFEYKDSLLFSMSGMVEWPQDIDNMLRLCLLLLDKIEDDALLTYNHDVIYLLRLNGKYKVNLSKNIWETPTGQAFLATTPYTTISYP
jgi:hypothetical protein